jgi:membrane protein involved in colicin uptake
LFDSAEQRHQDEVHAAEELARQQVAEENPGVERELLKINFSERVKQDDERRKAADPRQPQPAQQFAIFGIGAARAARVVGAAEAARALGPGLMPDFHPGV